MLPNGNPKMIYMLTEHHAAEDITAPAAYPPYSAPARCLSQWNVASGPFP